MTLETGVIPISETEQISPDLTEKIFLATPTGSHAEPFVHNGPYHSYKLSKIIFDNKTWIPILFFTDGRLTRVSLHIPPKATSWSTINPNEEERQTYVVKSALELQLQRTLPAKFPWGTIDVMYDQRSISGSMIFSYSKP